MVENDIFDLSVAKEENKFIEKSLLLESDVFSDVLEEMKDFPWVGSLIKLGKVGKGFMDLKFVWKIGRFLKKSEDIEQEKKEAFLANLDKKDRKRMYEYLMHLLYTAEEDRKADVMGMVYRDRIMENIDNDMFLRLCSAVNKVYIDDVAKLEEYVKPIYMDDYVSNNLYSAGLLKLSDPEGEDGGLFIGVRYELNDIGRHLLRILK